MTIMLKHCYLYFHGMMLIIMVCTRDLCHHLKKTLRWFWLFVYMAFRLRLDSLETLYSGGRDNMRGRTVRQLLTVKL